MDSIPQYRPSRRPKTRRPRLDVVAGIIVRDGHLLIGQRRKKDSHGLRWEFPGGKIESGESPPAALKRELHEELAIHADVGDELVRYEYAYPGRTPLQLIFFSVRSFTGEPVARAFEQIKWEPPHRLPAYDFLDGDVDFVRRLTRGEWKLL